MLNFMPTEKSEKCSQAQVKANASFSICAYRSFVVGSDLEKKETGFTSPFACSCSAPDKVENLLRHNVRTSSKLIGHTQELTGNKINNVLQSSTKGKCIVL